MAQTKPITNSRELIALIASDKDLLAKIEKAGGSVTGNLRQKILRDYARDLKRYIKTELENYYDLYHPVYYDRNGTYQGLRNAMDVVTVKTDDPHNTIAITFNDRAFSESYWDKHMSPKAALINEGWQVNDNVWFRDIKHFGYFEGVHYIEKGIEKFKKQHPEITVTLTNSIKGTTTKY